MMYATGVPRGPKADLQANAEAAVATFLAQYDHLDPAPAWLKATQEHLTAAVDAVVALASVLGRADDVVEVTIQGQANTNHGHEDGRPDEFMTLTVSALPPKEHHR